MCRVLFAEQILLLAYSMDIMSGSTVQSQKPVDRSSLLFLCLMIFMLHLFWVILYLHQWLTTGHKMLSQEKRLAFLLKGKKMCLQERFKVDLAGSSWPSMCFFFFMFFCTEKLSLVNFGRLISWLIVWMGFSILYTSSGQVVLLV